MENYFGDIKFVSKRSKNYLVSVFNEENGLKKH